jgi:hypothetical protein
MPKHTKQPPIIGYRRDGSIATDPRDALVFGYSEESLPRHGGGCSATLKRDLEDQLGYNAPDWVLDAEFARRDAVRKERGK